MKLRGWRGGPEMDGAWRPRGTAAGWMLEAGAEDRELSLESAEGPGMEPGAGRGEVCGLTPGTREAPRMAAGELSDLWASLSSLVQWVQEHHPFRGPRRSRTWRAESIQHVSCLGCDCL